MMQRTTITLEDALLEDLRVRAAAENVSVSKYIQHPLQAALAKGEADASVPRFERVTFVGTGARAGLSLDRTSALLALDGATATSLVNGPSRFGCSPLVLSGFIRIVTNRRVFREPTPPRLALRFCEAMLRAPNCVPVRPGPRHFEIFTDLCRSTSATGGLVAGAYHAALAIEHGCEWVTTDADVSPFPGLRWSHPLRPGP